MVVCQHPVVSIVVVGVRNADVKNHPPEQLLLIGAWLRAISGQLLGEPPVSNAGVRLPQCLTGIKNRSCA